MPTRHLSHRAPGTLLLASLISAYAATAAAADPVAHDSEPRGVQTPRNPSSQDRDGDGVSNESELAMSTDPDVPGLFPGSFPHVPEPLRFDLVRGLGAKRGEFEVNVLTSTTLLPYDGIAWAPEVEWAFADRFALEVEVPMHDAQVEAFKLAVQSTFRERRPRFIHGWQAMTEAQFAGAAEATWIYIAGRRLGRRWSLLGMLGPRVRVDDVGVSGKLIVNPSAFVDVRERVTLGMEHNGVIAGRDSSFHAIPQVHVQLGRHVRLQAGGGIEVSQLGPRPMGALRLVIE